MSTRDELISEAATAAAQRVDAESVGLDPVTIITILTQVLPLVISCFSKEEPSPQQIQEAVRRKTRRPRLRAAFRRKLSHSIQEKATEDLTDEQADALADAIIDESLHQNTEMVASVCFASLAPFQQE